MLVIDAVSDRRDLCRPVDGFFYIQCACCGQDFKGKPVPKSGSEPKVINQARKFTVEMFDAAHGINKCESAEGVEAEVSTLLTAIDLPLTAIDLH